MTAKGSKEPTAAEVQAALRSVIAKAKAGDTSVLPQLRTILDDNPKLVEHYGSLARQAEAAWMALVGGNDLYLREASTRAAETQRAELTRPSAQPIEVLLVERVVASGIQVQYFSATEANSLAAGDSFRQLQFHAKRVAQAQRMYLAAVGALTAYQRLVPAEAAVVAENKVAINEREEQSIAREEPPLVQNRTDPQSQARLFIEEEVDPPEPVSEERERLRVAISV